MLYNKQLTSTTDVMRSIQIACRLIVFSLLLAACQKVDFDNNPTGEGIEVGTFRIQSPTSSSTITLNAATPSQPVVLSWTAAKPGVDKPVTYKWIAVQKGGDIKDYKFELPADNDGKATTLTITQEKLDLYLFSKGVPANGTVELSWTIQASNGETQANSQDLFLLTLKRFGNGASPFILYGPEPITTTLTVDPTSTSSKFNFKWQKSTAATGSPAVKYKVVFALEGGDLNNPLFWIESNNSGSDSSLQVTYKQLSDSLNDNGQTDLSLESKLIWGVQAISGNWTQLSSVSNAMNIMREVRFFVVGSINNWDINAPIQIIPDKAPGRYAKVFYAYMLLDDGAAFKFFQTPGDWGSGYGAKDGSNGVYNTGFNQGDNINIADSGVYRITIDLEANKIYIQKRNPGTVGDFQGWDPPTYSPGVWLADNKFSSIVSGNGGFKFHDGVEWNNSAPDKSRWWGQEKGGVAGVLDIDGNGDNITAAGAPVRAIWDATNPQKPKYEVKPGAVFLIGDATAGGWDNNSPNLPSLVYQGNGKWKGTNIALEANKQWKFLLVKQSWDYNYGGTGGDAGSNPMAAGKIKSNGGNIGVSATGIYTVELDEINGTYKVY